MEERGKECSMDDILKEEFKLLYEESIKEETTASEKIALSDAMIRIYRAICDI